MRMARPLARKQRALAAVIRTAALDGPASQDTSELEQERWLSENEHAIEEYNAFVERNGAFSDDFREF